MAILSINPVNGETLKSYEALTAPQIEQKLALSAEVFKYYRKTTFSERAAWMNRAADVLESSKAEWGRLMTLEMGKPLKSAIEEAAKCATACRYYAENAYKFLSDQPVRTAADQSYVKFQPLGPILAIMPWNFPFWQVFRFIAPSLMAGNVGLLKHASNVPQCALAIEEIMKRAGFPEGVFQTLLIPSNQMTQIIEDPRVMAVTLTGSEAAGAQVASTAAKQIKKAVLELGGSDPFIVTANADLERAAEVAVTARTINNGQSCIAAKRFIVVESVADEFERRFMQGMKSLRVGDPMDEQTQIGPLATPQILKEVLKQVEDSVKAGARLLTGGQKLDRPGNFMSPGILTDIPKKAGVYRDEVFGPVALLFRVKNLEEALRLANDSPFGLGASFWSRDEAEQERFIDEIQAGLAFVNGMVASDPRLPFGGMKRSGYGRELGVFGIHEFVNIKTVWMKNAAGGASKSTTE